MRGAALMLVAIFAGCTQASAGNDPADRGLAKHRMRQQLRDLRTIERLLVSGDLEKAKLIAFMLEPPLDVAETNEGRDLQLAVGALRNARTLDEAIYAETRIAAACAHCHVKVQKLPAFRPPTGAPPDRPTIDAQMARHVWACDRMWEGMVAASDSHWRAGAYVLATSPLTSTSDVAPALARRLQVLGRAALDKPPSTLEGRSIAFAQMLATCTACHARRVTPPPRR
jgi:cytochrome c553